MSRHELFQAAEKLPADENRGELGEFDGVIAGAGDDPEKRVDEGGLVFFIDSVNRGVDAEAEEQALHHVAHAAAAPSEHDYRILGDHAAQPGREEVRVVAVAAGIGRAAAAAAAARGGGEVVFGRETGLAVHGVVF